MAVGSIPACSRWPCGPTLSVPHENGILPYPRLKQHTQILFDRARHWDVLEWAWFLLAHMDALGAHLHGDKVRGATLSCEQK